MNNPTKIAGFSSLLQGFLFLFALLNLLVLQSAIGFTTAEDWIDPIKIKANFWPLMVTPLIQFALCAVVVVLALALYDHLGASSPHLMRLSVIAAIGASSLLLLSASFEYVYRSLLDIPPSVLAKNQALILYMQKDVAGTLRVTSFFVLGWSTLLWSWAGIRSRLLSRSVCLTALFSGIFAILLQLIPVFIIFYMIWSFWLGITLLGKQQGSALLSASQSHNQL